MLKMEGGRHIPIAIDHDTSFVTANNSQKVRTYSNHGTAPLTLPTVIDTRMREQVLAMTGDDLVRIMGPLAESPERLGAAQSRLTEMQAHLRAEPSSVMVIEPDGWGSTAVHDQLAAGPGNYWHFLMVEPRSAQ